MTLFREKYRIETSRLMGYDYSQAGAYFITIVTKDRIHSFGEITDDMIVINEPGKIVIDCWLELPNHFDNIILDDFIIMPNHIHCILILTHNNINRRDLIHQVSQSQDPNNRRDLIHQVSQNQDPNDCRDLIHQVSQNQDPNDCRDLIHQVSNTPDHTWILMKQPGNQIGKIIRHFKGKSSKLIHDAGFIGFQWQSRFHDHIIWDEFEMNRIRQYIVDNPINWNKDEYF